MSWLRNTCPMCGWVLFDNDFGRCLIRAGSHSMNCPRKGDFAMPYQACPVGTPIVDLTQARRIKFNEFDYWGLWVEGSNAVYFFLNASSTNPVTGVTLDEDRPADIENARDAMRKIIRHWEAIKVDRNRHVHVIESVPVTQAASTAPDLEVGQYGKSGPSLFD